MPQSNPASHSRSSIRFEESRRMERQRMISPVRLGWINDETRMEYIAGRCIDISSSGLAIATAQRLRLSALVHVDVAEQEMAAIGRVRNCIRTGDGWRAGIELMPMP